MQSKDMVLIPILAYNIHVKYHRPMGSLGENYTWVLGHVQGLDQSIR